MIFYRDPKYVGTHCILSPSSHRLDQDRSEEELTDILYSTYATEIGTTLHELAADYIDANVRPNKSGLYDAITVKLHKKGIPRGLIDPDRYVETLLMYIKDSVGFGMTAEVPLIYMPKIAGGTVDAISYNDKKRYLRIHDLKTGRIPAKMNQLAEYAAYFFLVYHKKPADVSGIELRIYQNGEAIIDHPTASDISPICDRIVTQSKYYASFFEEG